MTEIRLFKGSAARGSNEDVSSLRIESLIPVPAFAELKDAGECYDKEAEKLVDALYKSLPGGTMDRVLIKMLERQASLFRVTHTTIGLEKG